MLDTVIYSGSTGEVTLHDSTTGMTLTISVPEAQILRAALNLMLPDDDDAHELQEGIAEALGGDAPLFEINEEPEFHTGDVVLVDEYAHNADGVLSFEGRTTNGFVLGGPDEDNDYLVLSIDEPAVERWVQPGHMTLTYRNGDPA